MPNPNLRVALIALGAGVVSTVVGCGSGDSASTGNSATMDELAASLDPPPPAATSQDQHAISSDQGSLEPTGADPIPPEDQSAMTSPEAIDGPSNGVRTEAGRAPIGEGGYFVAIGGARRQILNRVEDLAWTQAVQHFQATEGRLPRDHEEFMTKVVEFHGIDLGYKEEDQEFLYDPTEGRFGTVYVVAKEPAPGE